MLLNSAKFCRTLSKSMPQRNQPASLPSTARTRLAALGEKKPRTMAAQVRALWPEIKAALDRGHTLKTVCECLEADGLQMTVYTLGSYVARMRRKSTQVARVPDSTSTLNQVGATSRSASEPNNASVGDQSSADPLANVRRSEAKRPGFDYRPELADPEKLI